MAGKPQSLIVVDGDYLAKLLHRLGLQAHQLHPFRFAKFLLAAGESYPLPPAHLRYYRTVRGEDAGVAEPTSATPLPAPVAAAFRVWNEARWTVVWQWSTPVYDEDGHQRGYKGLPDTRIVLDVARIVFRPNRSGVNRVVLLTGDRDFLPLITDLRIMGIHTVIVGAHNPSFYRPLSEAANATILLEEHLDAILRDEIRTRP